MCANYNISPTLGEEAVTNYIETYKGYKASLPPPLIQEMFALRKASFIDRRNWDIDTNGFESKRTSFIM